MIYHEAPSRAWWDAEKANPYDRGDPTLFLAGGITGCPDWQAKLCDLLRDERLVVFNPRRADFDVTDPNAAATQIRWEHDHLRAADAISFWFSAATIQPIVLYELGAWSMTDKPLFIGIEPGYPRWQDVTIQTSLARPDIGSYAVDLGSLAEQIKTWLKR